MHHSACPQNVNIIVFVAQIDRSKVIFEYGAYAQPPGSLYLHIASSLKIANSSILSHIVHEPNRKIFACIYNFALLIPPSDNHCNVGLGCVALRCSFNINIDKRLNLSICLFIYLFIPFANSMIFCFNFVSRWNKRQFT